MLARLVAGLCASIALSAPSSGQCAQWDEGFHVGFDQRVWATCVFDDGGGPALYAGGDFTVAGGVPASRIARWDGASWSALGGGTDDMVLALAVFDDGNGPALYAGGRFTTADGAPASRIAKWDGNTWSPLGSGIDGWGSSTFVYSLAVFDDGNGPALYAGGAFTTAGGGVANRIARWNGTGWSPLGNGVDGAGSIVSVHALLVFDDGSGASLYAGGFFASVSGVSSPGLARWDGASWSAVGGGLGTTGDVRALAAFDDGGGPALYAGGGFQTASGVPARRIARWDGTSWSSVGGGLDDTVWALTTFDDGGGPALYAGGYPTTAGGVPVTRIARWDGASWSALGSGVQGSGSGVGVFALTAFDDGAGPALVAGGSFSIAGGVPASGVATWDGTSWSAVGATGNGMSARVRALTTFDDGAGPALYAGGRFTIAGGFPASFVAKKSGTSWSALGGGLGGSSTEVLSLGTFDDGGGPALYAGGIFTTAGGAPAPGIARWDGASWSALGTGIAGAVEALYVFDDGSGPALYAGGSFSSAGGVAAACIARWDGNVWSALGGGVSGAVPISWVFDLAAFDDGNGSALYAGGRFATAGGVSTANLARWDGASWSAVGPGGSGMNGDVLALVVFDDGGGPALYAGGAFTTADGVPAARVAKWDGASWSALGGGTNNSVHSLAVFDDGGGPALYAGGTFTTAGGVPASRIAKWDGIRWSALGGGLSVGVTSTAVYALTAFDDGADGDADLYVGGDFTWAGGPSSWHVAQWHGCGSGPQGYCFGDGSAAACPCANSGLAGRGCENSAATGGALLSSSGTTSPDALVLEQQGELASSLSIFLQGSAELASPLPFGDGLRCAGGSLKRLYVHNAIGGSVSAPQPGEPSITLRSAQLGDPIAPGSVRHYQVYYRDPDLAFCPGPTGSSFNVGNALRVTW